MFNKRIISAILGSFYKQILFGKVQTGCLASVASKSCNFGSYKKCCAHCHEKWVLCTQRAYTRACADAVSINQA